MFSFHLTLEKKFRFYPFAPTSFRRICGFSILFLWKFNKLFKVIKARLRRSFKASCKLTEDPISETLRLLSGCYFAALYVFLVTEIIIAPQPCNDLGNCGMCLSDKAHRNMLCFYDCIGVSFWISSIKVSKTDVSHQQDTSNTPPIYSGPSQSLVLTLSQIQPGKSFLGGWSQEQMGRSSVETHWGRKKTISLKSSRYASFPVYLYSL